MPSKPGVYEFLNKENVIIYVGKAVDLKSRVSSYFTGSHLGEKTRLLVSQIDKIRITIVESELEALLLEAHFIKKHNPRFNIRLTDNKAYILVKITNMRSRNKVLDLSENEDFSINIAFNNDNKTNKTDTNIPSVQLARRMDDPKSIYFGPFPSSGNVKLVLKIIRRVFPFQSAENHPRKICLYNHLGLCPCIPVNDTPETRREYKKNIKGIIRVFQGETKKIIREFERERDRQSKNENFEKAAMMQKRIDALSYITQPYRRPYEYDLNPNLRSDIRQEELNNLLSVLRANGSPAQNLNKIECYDISNTQGTNATASMVVFVNGEKEGKLYRKYKIRRESTPDDFASMSEVLRRRLKHTEWDYPGLIIVDGGKGQVSSAVNTLASENINLPIIGLAKREETIIIPQGLGFKEVSLAKDSKGLLLMMRIRDEAHRFAITYHRKLRSKAALSK